MINSAPMRANGTKTHVPSASASSDFLSADGGDLLIRGFWEGSTDTIIDVRVTNLDSKSYKNLPPKKALERQDDVLLSCYAQRRISTTSISFFSYLGNKHNARIIFDPRYPNLDYSNFEKRDWSSFYGEVKEEIPVNIPTAHGNEFIILCYLILTMLAISSLEDPELDLQCFSIQPQFTGSPRSRIVWRHRASAQSFVQ